MHSNHFHALRRELRLPLRILIASLLFCVSTLSWAEIDQISEPQIKATYLFNFAKYIDWPSETTSRANSNLTICVLGRSPFGEALNTFAGKVINGRHVVIITTNRLEDIKQCDILYVCPSEKTRLGQILSSVSSRPIVTVSSIKHFISAGGMINFVIINDKVRFEISNANAQRSRLIISAQLLKLASRIID